ncbi:MAG: putative Flp pilus assembly protein TadC [Alphaproteobacteria bacterium]|jgi:tight adherence protein C|nr:putative Flp pilus assembly protein TadC [Alphaproteobacteria bacterium]
MNLDRLLSHWGFTPDEIFIVMASLTTLVITVLIWQTLLVRDRIGPKMRLLAHRRAAMKEDYLAGDTPDSEVTDLMRRILRKLKLLRGASAEKAAVKLTQAGLRGKNVMVYFMFARLALPFVFGVKGMMLFKWMPLWKMKDFSSTLFVLGAVVLGALAPAIYVANMRERRKQQLEKAIPDCLDLLVIAAEAGLSLDAAFQRVAHELGPAWPEMAEELQLTSIELTFLDDRRRAMENFVLRTDLDSIRAVINTLRQTEKYGTPLSQSLRVLSAEFRDNRMMKAEEKAARLPVLMTLPMVAFILPPLFVVLIGPAILSMIDHLSKF